MKKCMRCGRNNLDDMLFCGYCAENIGEEFGAATILPNYFKKTEEEPNTLDGKPRSNSFLEIAEENGEYVLKKLTGFIRGGMLAVPRGVTVIGEKAFYECYNLTELIIPEDVTYIDSDAFSGCKCLTKVMILNGVKTIGSRTFCGCYNLKDFIIPPSGPEVLESICYMAFWNCQALTRFNIPYSVTSIGDYAFGNCLSLETMIIPKRVMNIGRDVFMGCNKLTLQVYPGTLGERYAKENGISYELILIK